MLVEEEEEEGPLPALRRRRLERLFCSSGSLSGLGVLCRRWRRGRMDVVPVWGEEGEEEGVCVRVCLGRSCRWDERHEMAGEIIYCRLE